MRRHKKQHFVPQSYLEAWTDPDCPEGLKPFVWVFNKDGTEGRRRAPKNIFHETDMYTIQNTDGVRDLQLERALAGLESGFARIRREKLSQLKPLDEEEHTLMCAFIAAARARTPSRRDHNRKQWGRGLKVGDDLKKRLKTATPEEKRAMARIPRSLSKGPSISLDELRKTVESPLQTLMLPEIVATANSLINLDMTVIQTDDEIGFITSDRPCVWYDRESYKRHPHHRAPATMYPTIEISFPISPQQLVLFNKAGLTGYDLDTNLEMVLEFNWRTRIFADKQFVVRKNHTDPIWLHPGVVPNDSWENTHGSSQ